MIQNTVYYPQGWVHAQGELAYTNGLHSLVMFLFCFDSGFGVLDRDRRSWVLEELRGYNQIYWTEKKKKNFKMMSHFGEFTCLCLPLFPVSFKMTNMSNIGPWTWFPKINNLPHSQLLYRFVPTCLVNLSKTKRSVFNFKWSELRQEKLEESLENFTSQITCCYKG